MQKMQEQFSAKELRKININGKASAFLDDALYLFNGLLPISVWPKSKTVIGKCRIKNRREYLSNRLLNDAVFNCRNTELTDSSVGLFDFYTTNRIRFINT